MLEPLTPAEQRVIGALAEKAATVPDTYPMTRNGLRTACNQKNNREPVTEYDDHTIQRTLDDLKAAGLVRFVHASHGARTTKYRHVLDGQLRLDPAELSLVTVLLLRGPQTLNELRVRTERHHPFENLEAVEAVLEDLAAREPAIVEHLPRQPGQKETRWTHLLGPRPEGEAEPQPRAAGSEEPAPTGLEARVSELEARVAQIEELLTSTTEETNQ